jgi:hypothetical protein
MAMTKPLVMPADIQDAYAIQAVAQGEGGPNEQIRAIRCIVNELSKTYDMSFDEESPRMTDFNEGNRHIGRTIVNIINQNLGQVTKATELLNKLKLGRGKDNG